MNWAAWGPTIVAVVTAIFTAGAVVGRVRGQEKLLGEHHERLDGHDGQLAAHGERIARQEAWREGYNAGRKREQD